MVPPRTTALPVRLLPLSALLAACAAPPPPLADLHPPGAADRPLPPDRPAARDLLTDPAVPWPAREAVWREARRRGWTGRLEEELRAAADRSESGPRAWIDLGNLLVLKLRQAAGTFARARLAREAESCYDRALARDPANWEAAFRKAVTLAHWPPFTGRRQEALTLLEKLTRRQEGLPRQERFALTWLFLGDLRAREGDERGARAAWRRGLERHPENRQLQRKLAPGGEVGHAR